MKLKITPSTTRQVEDPRLIEGEGYYLRVRGEGEVIWLSFTKNAQPGLQGFRVLREAIPRIINELEELEQTLKANESTS